MPKFPIDVAQIVALFMESIFYGSIYLVTFFASMRVLLWSDGRLKSKYSINFAMVTAALLMFIFGTMDVAFGLQHVLDAFIFFHESAKVAFMDTRCWVNVMKMVDFVAQTFIGDCILIYRCWIIYGRNHLVVIAPILLLMAGAACGIVTIVLEATSQGHTSSPLNKKQLVPFITSMLSLTLATNVLTTSLIIHRIRLIRFKSGLVLDRCLSTALRVVIESGLLYTSSILILFGTYLASNNAQFGVSDSVVQIIGITFNLIITRVDQANSSKSMTDIHTGSLPIHVMTVKTTVSCYPADGEYDDVVDKHHHRERRSTWETADNVNG